MEVHRDVSLSGPEKDDILALPDIGIISAVDPDSMGSLDLYQDPDLDPGGQKYVLPLTMTHKHRKKLAEMMDVPF
jgi:hypothetical protein